MYNFEYKNCIFKKYKIKINTNSCEPDIHKLSNFQNKCGISVFNLVSLSSSEF